jgi:hypothetical protein
VVRAVFDTSILVDFLCGVPQAKAELARYQSPAISLMSWIEVMAGTIPETESVARSFLQTFDLFPIDELTAQRAAGIRRTHRIKIPDAVIWATAQVHQCLLVTRNSRDFDPAEPGIRIPYRL